MSGVKASHGVDLRIPAGYRAHWLAEPGERGKVEEWASASREGCVYNTAAYVEFARAQNGRGDLLWLTREGNPVLGFPVHPLGGARVGTGYSGVMFAGGPGERALRAGAVALVALLAANGRLGFEVLQSAQAPAYGDPAYMTSLACMLASHGLRGPSLYSRVLGLDSLGDVPVAAPDVSGDLLLDHGLRPYQAELRNQIRQALRRGLHVTCALPANDAELLVHYGEFAPLHEESWRRTGMTPHPLDYWLALGRAIVDGGGRDMMVFVRAADGRALAAVTCHLRGGRAVYWAGASSEQGLAARANPLCLHAAIQAARQLGVRHFELGRFAAGERSNKELSVTRYKAQFGGELVRIVGFRTRPPAVAAAGRRLRDGISAMRARRPFVGADARAAVARPRQGPPP